MLKNKVSRNKEPAYSDKDHPYLISQKRKHVGIFRISLFAGMASLSMNPAVILLKS
jgi:hypothetical protein